MGTINYTCRDNLEYMKSLPDNYYNLAFADPEQGKKEHGGTNRSGYVKQKNGSKLFVKDGGYKKKDWDNKPASKEYFDELIRISQHQIIWGEQYFDYYFGKGRIVWDKVNGNSDQYDCEIAYCSLSDRTTLFRYQWSGMLQGKSIKEGHITQGNKKLNEKRFHPTQKPSALYLWKLMYYKIPLDWKIFDPNLGSGSVGIACLQSGHNLDACEVDPEMYDLASKWLKEEQLKMKSQLKLNLK